MKDNELIRIMLSTEGLRKIKIDYKVWWMGDVEGWSMMNDQMLRWRLIIKDVEWRYGDDGLWSILRDYVGCSRIRNMKINDHDWL